MLEHERVLVDRHVHVPIEMFNQHCSHCVTELKKQAQIVEAHEAFVDWAESVDSDFDPEELASHLRRYALALYAAYGGDVDDEDAVNEGLDRVALKLAIAWITETGAFRSFGDPQSQ